MSFDNKLELIYSDKASEDLGADYWVVGKRFTCILDKENNKQVTIPKGFLTDGASVPRMFWSLFPSWGKYGQAACVHDFLCEYLIISHNGVVRSITRKECDRYFLQLMKEMKVGWFKRSVMYLGVSLFRIVAKVKDPSITARKVALEDFLTHIHNKTGVWE